MSNIGKKPIEIKQGTQVELQGDKIKVTGPKGSLDLKIPPSVVLEIRDNIIRVKKGSGDEKEVGKLFGLMRSLVANMVIGVVSGFEKKLELVGVGFRGRIEGGSLVLNVGYAVPVVIKPPEGISISVSENIITVSGINKEIVGDVASKVRGIKPPDSYKGKGIRYVGEKIRKKAGKAAKAAGVK